MKLGQHENRRQCWEKDVHAECLRVELAEGSFYVFPHSRFQCSHFEGGADQDQLCLSFDTHEIRIAGKNLRQLGVAFQKFVVNCVRVLPARYMATTDHETVSISSIKVSEREAPQSPDLHNS
jgi:hypothetical protein